MASDDQKLQLAKENLQKPLENLRTVSTSLISFTLQWKHLEEYLASIRKSIEEFESEPDQIPNGESSDQLSTSLKEQYHWFVDPRPEMKQFCVDMDGKGLRLYLIEKLKESRCSSTRKEVASALLLSPDPALLVLDALLGFYPDEEDAENSDLVDTRRACVVLLKKFMKVAPLSIRPEVIEEARKMAMDWKDKISSNCKSNWLEVVGFLLLLAAYRLDSEFNGNGELFDLVEIIAWRPKAPRLCRKLGFKDMIPGFVENLIQKRKQIEAINFIYEFGLVDNFPVGPLLKQQFWYAKKEAKEICKMGNKSLESQCEAIDRKMTAFEAVIRCIESHKIKCKYNTNKLRKQLDRLVREKRDIRDNAGISTNAVKHQQWWKRRWKRRQLEG